MEDLESKINEELTSLKDKLTKIQTDSAKFTNVDELRYETEEKRNKLILEQQDLAEKKSDIQALVHNLQVEYDHLQVTKCNKSSV